MAVSRASADSRWKVRNLPFLVLGENLFLPVLREKDKRLPKPAQEESILPIYVVMMELHFLTLPLRASLCA